MSKFNKVFIYKVNKQSILFLYTNNKQMENEILFILSLL